MSNPEFKNFAEELIFEEIIPSLSEEIKMEDKLAFARDVIDRFSNGNIEHKWKSIAVQYPMKLTIRILPLLKSYIKEKGETPTKMVACIHEIFHFLLGNVEVQIDEISKAAIEQIHLKRIAADEKITLLLKEENIWGEDLTQWIKI